MMMTNSLEMTQNKTNNPYATATAAYGARQDANMSGFEVTAKLYEGMLRFIGQAKNAHANNKLEDMCTYIQKTNKILMALQSNLNFEEGGQASVYLNDLYMEVFKRLFKVLRADDPQAEFDYVRSLLEPVSKIWASHAENAKKANPDTHVQAPTTVDN
jgi:flagellar biosynthetic protein FliS